jgi:hypothetical protein
VFFFSEEDAQALKCLTLSAAQGYAEALYDFLDLANKNPSAESKKIKKNKKIGDAPLPPGFRPGPPKTQNELGKMFSSGDGVGVNKKQRPRAFSAWRQIFPRRKFA